MSIKQAFLRFPALETKRLSLRQMTLSDSDELLQILSDDETVQFYDDDVFTEVAQANDQIHSWNEGYKNRRCIRWGITKKKDNKLIGSCGLHGIYQRHKRASIGYELLRSHWRQGIMTEALKSILDYGFNKMDLNRIDALIMPGNIGSVRLLEKIGFQREGLLSEYEIWGSKGHVDLLMYAILRKSWKPIRYRM